jgi:imidazolonepropionase
MPREFAQIKTEVDLKGQTVLPGFVECHTHTVFAGSRSAEFELRNQGVSYQEIAAKGGGILSTMKATRKISAVELQKNAQVKVDRFVQQGVTTLEIKSGYALDEKNELKCLQVAKSLKGPRIVTTFLGAHALPPEYKSYEEYLNFLVVKVLPQVKKKNLSNRVDIFVEKGFFNREVALPYLQKAKGMGFELVLHADQLSLSGGADLAVQLQALSADHLIQITDSEISKLAKSNVTGVLLPAADLYMKCAYPPARKLINAGARVALATDFNPGSSPTQDLSLVGLLARLEMKMTLPEVIAAYTYSAAAALNLQLEIGSIEPEKNADFVSINNHWNEIFYSIGINCANEVYKSAIRLV